jgi:hypothetical protein
MSLSSTSTDAEIWAAYDDNGSYEENNSRAQALAFKSACILLDRRRPTLISRGNRTVEMSSLDKRIEDVSAFIATHPASGSSGSRVRYFSMENFGR